MPAVWTFNQLRPGDKNREAVHGEFFATTAIRDTAEALVREAIQNSLDAGTAERVRVRIYVSGEEGALSVALASKWIKRGWDHFEAPGNGLNNAPARNDSCPFLAIEDFGTTGLIGDQRVHFLPETESNPFYYFFRAEGRSSKVGDERGRWGIGKFVFPKSSELRTFFAMSVPGTDGSPFLMGQAILRSHEVDGTPYHPDGWFGQIEDRGLIVPITDQELLATFRSHFHLQRQLEPGLSIVVPYCAKELEYKAFIRATIRSYFYPILNGGLEVRIEGPNGGITLNRDTLLPTLDITDQELKSEMLVLVQLAQLASSDHTLDILTKPTAAGALKWTDDQFAHIDLSEWRTRLADGESIAIKVPIGVRYRDDIEKESFFRVYLRHDRTSTSRPMFIRAGIIIPDVRAPRSRGYRALVLVDEGPLARLLGDSENPSHTQWQPNSGHFKGRYSFGPSYIRYVKESVSSILRVIYAEDQAEDRSALIDLFSIPRERTDDPKEGRRSRGRNKQDDSSRDPIVIQPKVPRYALRRTDDGFVITNGHPESVTPAALDIRVAYDCRRGSPLKNYSPNDFRIDRGAIRFDPPPTGLTIIRASDNKVVAAVNETEFKLSVAGFDTRRDLFIEVRLKDQEDIDG